MYQKLILAFLLFVPNFVGAVRGEEPAAWSWQDRWVTQMAPLGNGKYLATIATGLPYREGAVVEFSLPDPNAAKELYKQNAAVWGLAVSPDQKTVATTDYQGSLAIGPLGGEIKHHEKAFVRWTRALTFASDGLQLVAGNEAGSVFAWSVAESKTVATKDLASGQVMAIAFSPSGNRLAVATGSGKLHVLKWPGFEPVKEIAVSDQPLWSVIFAGDEDHFWTGGADGVVRYVGLEGEPKSLGKMNDWVTSLAPLPGGGVVAVSLRGQVKRAASGSDEALRDWATGPSGIWDVLIADPDTVLVATRKGGPAIFRNVGQLQYADGKDLTAKPTPKAESEPKAAEVDAKKAEEMKAEEKKAEEKKAEEKKAEEKKAEEKKAEEKKAEEKKAEEKKAEEKKAEEKKAEEKKAEEKKAEEKKAEEKKAEEKKAEEKKAEEKK
jgi:hypothetical protein